MRKLTPIALLLCLLTVPVLAGDVGTPPRQDPPPCSENCTPPSGGGGSIIWPVIVKIALIIIKK